MRKTTWARLLMIGALAAVLGCNGEMNQNASPVQLLVSTSQNIQQIDLAGGANCDQTIATINMESRVKNSNLDTRFLDTRITSYRVTFRRTDGGTAVPAQYVRSIDILIGPNTTASDVVFHISDFGQIYSQAPFVSLLPINGGVDPETKQRRLKFNVTVELFGQTLAGDRVYGSTTFPLDYCYNCNGCSA